MFEFEFIPLACWIMYKIWIKLYISAYYWLSPSSKDIAINKNHSYAYLSNWYCCRVIENRYIDNILWYKDYKLIESKPG